MWYGFRRRIGPHKEILRTLWDNRDSLPRAWKILNEGVCDGCALGTKGLRDWTIDGIHLCWIRLNLLRLNTMPAMDPAVMQDADALRGMDERQLRGLGRLDRPWLREAGDKGFRELSWEEAESLAARALSESDPLRSAWYLVSRGTLNESYYAFQKAARRYGSPHIDNSARICHAPSTVGLKQSTGFGATTCSYRDLFQCKLLVLFGSDLANNQPVMMKYLHLARKKGLRIVSVNPYREPGLERYWVPSNADSALLGTKVADAHFRVRVGGDIAFIHGTLKALLEADTIDRAFIEARTEGWPELEAALRDTAWPELEASSGVSRAEMERMAELYAQAESAILCWSMGVTMHRRGVDTVQAIANLALARANVGRPGSGLMPIRGHSGVQGGAEMGCAPNLLPGGLPLEEEALRRLEKHWGFRPPAGGEYISQSLARAAEGDLDLLWCVGSNLFAVFPDSDSVKRALGRIPYRIHQDIVLNPQVLVDAGRQLLLLPATTRYEVQGGGCETTTERRVIYSPEIPGSRIEGAREEWRVLQAVLRRLDPEAGQALPWRDTAEIRREIEALVPSYKGIAGLERGGQHFQIGGSRLGGDGRFDRPGGKALFLPLAVDPPEEEDGLFALNTRRGKQFNSMVFGEKDMLNDEARDAVVMHAKDLERLGLAADAAVKLSSASGEFRGRARPGPVRPGTVLLCWPEANTLIAAGDCDPRCGIPAYRDARVRVEAL